MRNYILSFVVLIFFISTAGYSQDVNIRIGIRDSIQSRIMRETRKLMVSLPSDYKTSDRKYPVLFVLDGSENSLVDARLITSKLGLEFIIVAVSNTDRDRDMMPLSAPSYIVKNPEAEIFLSFIEKELIPYIDENYRSDGQRTIWGRSLSGVFVMYAFLAKPELFSNYLGNCAGWYSDMSTYFNSLANRSFQAKERYKGKKLFVANSTTDPYDPKREIHKEMLDFSEKIRSVFGNSISFKYATYENAAHVPYSGFYDGMKYFLEGDRDSQLGSNRLVGTWRIVEYSDFDTITGQWKDRYGRHPRGYFIYTSSGIVSINISTDTPMKVSEDSAKSMSVSYFQTFRNNGFGYFGTYTVDWGKSIVTHHVKGGSLLWYIDTDQPRQFMLNGDTLIIGDNKTTKRVLTRVD